MHDLLKVRGLLNKVTFISNARVNLIDDEMCEILKKLNVKLVRFGFESGSERVLKYLKAGSASVKQNKEAIMICKRHNLTVLGAVIFGSPGETIEEMNETID